LKELDDLTSPNVEELYSMTSLKKLRQIALEIIIMIFTQSLL